MKKVLFLIVFSVLTISNLFADEEKNPKIRVADLPGLRPNFKMTFENGEPQDILVETTDGRTHMLMVGGFVHNPNKFPMGVLYGLDDDKSAYIVSNQKMEDIKRIEVGLRDERGGRHSLEWKNPSHTFNKAFWALNVVMVGAVIYDMETTLYTFRKCAEYKEMVSCREGDPLLRPFIKHGRPAIYAFQAAVTAGRIYMAYRLRKQGKHLRWIVPTIVAMGIHSAYGSKNLMVVWKLDL